MPPIADLRKLENAALILERDEATKMEEALADLIRPCGTLGGARPKENVIDPSGALWIAKLSSERDDIDVSDWEAVRRHWREQRA